MGHHTRQRAVSASRVEEPVRAELGLPLEELIRRAARDLLQRAIAVEVAPWLEELARVSLLDGRRAVVRYGQRATLITSQLPVEHWHDLIGDPTLADAILDRLIHNAYRATLKGESMRKRNARTLTQSAPTESQ